MRDANNGQFGKVCLQLKYSSFAYLILSWLVAISTALINVSLSNISLFLYEISLYTQFPIILISLYFTWQWLKKLYTFSKDVDKNKSLTYRTGWSFWGWIVPIAFFWIPRKMIDQSFSVLGRTKENTLESITKNWNTLWVISILVSNLSFRAFANDLFSVDLILVVIESVLLTFAYPMWIKIIDNSNTLVMQR
jgi:hypothetical protein